MSPIADNLTTALLMATVVMAVGGANRKFVVLGCINVVVAANSGGAFSPFGDITTLMVWQAGHVEFQQFFALLIPSVVNWVVTAGIMSMFLPNGKPDAINEKAVLREGAWIVVALFVMTITLAVLSHTLLHMPPVIGMMTGLGLLKLYGYYLQTHGGRFNMGDEPVVNDIAMALEGDPTKVPDSGDAQYDIYRKPAESRVGHAVVLLRNNALCCRSWRIRLPRRRFRLSVRCPWANDGQHTCRLYFSDLRQHSGHVCSITDGANNEPRPVAAHNIDRGCRRLDAGYRFLPPVSP